jgi:DNA-directed RNA polymerase subunit M/transcription elongation factor TFIIS
MINLFIYMTKENHINIFSKYISKKNATILTNHIYEFCNEYAENNGAIFLIDSIIDTKVEFIKNVFEKNDYLKIEIKNKNIDPKTLCYLKQEEIEPEKYKNILEKRELEEYRKNNRATSNAFKCKKCGESKCQVTQKQTRSGDEPATTFVTCMECGFMFKF